MHPASEIHAEAVRLKTEVGDNLPPDIARLAAELELAQLPVDRDCCDGTTLTALWAAWAAGAASAPASAPPLQHAPRAPTRPFVADLVREAGQARLGLTLAVRGGRGGVLIITGIEPASAAEAWNDKCCAQREPWRRLHMYSTVLAVNGVAGDIRHMQQLLEGSIQVRLLACSPPTLHDALVTLQAVSGAEEPPAHSFFWAGVSRELAAGVSGEQLAETDSRPSLAETQDGPRGRAVVGLGTEVADVTVIVTTSPVPSNPSTEMLQGVLRSLALVPGLQRAPRILVCDGYTVVPPGQKPRHKAGKILPEDAVRYDGFIREVRAAMASATDGTESGTFAHLQVLELTEHHGFGFAVKRGLQEVSTTFVLVVQHDQEFVRGFDLPGVLRAMSSHPDHLKYVGLCSSTTQSYEHMVLSKYGLRVARTLEFGVPFLPLIFFYDKPHVCSLRHYRDTVLGPDSPVRRGDFIEETLGRAQREDILRHGLSVHGRYGTYQLDERDEAGEALAIVRHVNGRSFLSPWQRAERGWPASLTFTA